MGHNSKTPSWILIILVRFHILLLLGFLISNKVSHQWFMHLTLNLQLIDPFMSNIPTRTILYVREKKYSSFSNTKDKQRDKDWKSPTVKTNNVIVIVISLVLLKMKNIIYLHIPCYTIHEYNYLQWYILLIRMSLKI